MTQHRPATLSTGNRKVGSMKNTIAPIVGLLALMNLPMAANGLGRASEAQPQPPPAPGQPRSIEGNWLGRLRVAAFEYRLAMMIAKTREGPLAGTLRSL